MMQTFVVKAILPHVIFKAGIYSMFCLQSGLLSRLEKQGNALL